MTSILHTIAEHAKVRVEEAKKQKPLSEVKKEALAMEPLSGFPFEKALAEGDISFICECKKASPSKGLIAEDFPYVEIAREYERAGASCISVLTEPKWFLGSDRYLQETIRQYKAICDQLGLSALVEAHDEEEIAMALRAGARIIGVNNRNLKDFTVDVHNSERLRSLVPPSVLFVAESGIKTAEDIGVLRKAGVNGVLIGETLMRSPDKKAVLDTLKGIRS